MSKSPCYGCENREAGCHGKCKSYISFRNECDDLIVVKRKSKDIDAYYIDQNHKRNYISWLEPKSRGRK